MFIMHVSGFRVENRLCQSKRQSRRPIRRLFQNPKTPRVGDGVLDKGVVLDVGRGGLIWDAI